VNTVRVGLIGAGGIANYHISHLKKLKGVDVCAVCDVNEEAARATGERHGIKHVFKNYRDLLKLKDVDAVSVCTPNSLHVAPTIDALKLGKHVMVEKPMAMTPAEAERMVKAARAAKRVLVIGFQWRYHPTTMTIKRAVDEGVLGKICYARCQALRRRGIPNWGVFGQKSLQGGGPMIDIGVHVLEATHYVMGKPKPVSATGNCYTYLGNKKSQTACPWPNWDHKTYTVEDLAVGMVRFANGATLVIECSFAAHIEKDVFNFTLMGEKGGANFDPPTLYTDIAGTSFNMTPWFTGQDKVWETKMQDWIDAIRTGKTPTSPGEDGVVVQKMLNAIYLSSETGREVLIK